MFLVNSKGRGAIDLVRAARNSDFQGAVSLLESLCGKVEQTPALAENAVLSPEGDEISPIKKEPWKKSKCPASGCRSKSQMRLPEVGRDYSR
jgi:hypothetical protein